ncbi:GSCFA domain-containing protein [Pontibacter roseus]|uniref:GSCFA domain-containing protein n=1 Tax=Pontibacter roseus TaxID=336989 RepID=UPI00036699B3|nr:GSCFA domain-containing protein [Pontibacter roseus]
MFRTEVNIPSSGLDLTLQDGIVTMGSCFADVIGNRLRQNKAKVLVSPFGTIFNPLSVCKLLDAATGEQPDWEQHLVQHQGIWYAYDLHSSLSSPDKTELLQLISHRLQTTQQALQEAKLLIITLGTAVGYRLHSTGQVVANCHRLPARNFTRQLLSTDEMMNAFGYTLYQLRRLNPGLKVLLTVSPVRHIKETLETNSVSKALLRVICHLLVERHEEVSYFPAYEIMLDDLRDYRFYGRDMLHPTETAEDYIWEKFTAAYLHPDFIAFHKEWGKMRRALAHRPFHPNTEAHQSFLRNTLQQLQQLQLRYGIAIEPEEQLLREQLIP